MNDSIQVSIQEEEKPLASLAKHLITDISQLIDNAKIRVSRDYNITQIQLCWFIGNRIDEEILKSKKAQYGEQIIEHLADELTLKYGRGFSRPNLFKMFKFTKLFADLEIVSTVSRQFMLV